MSKKTAETSTTTQFVDTLWDQFEQAIDLAEKFRERQEDAYLQTVKQTIRFNKNVRGSLINFYQTSKQRNRNIIKGVSDNVSARFETSRVVNPELLKQAREVTGRLEQLAEAPVQLGLGLLDRADETFEDSSERYVNYARNRRNAWQNVTKEYAKAAKNSHKNLVSRVEDSLKVLAGNTK